MSLKDEIEEELKKAYEKGFEEGFNESFEKATVKFVKHLSANGKTLAEIVDLLGISEQKATTILNSSEK